MGTILEVDPLPQGADDNAAFSSVLQPGVLRAVFQPIVRLDGQQTVAWEALVRGPVGSDFAFPDVLFGTAARLGRTAELDQLCQIAAIDGALAAGMNRSQELFVNVEPDGADAPVGDALERARDRAQSRLRLSIEITERSLTAAPAQLISLVDSYRRRGWGIALDDVGEDRRSVALMPLLRPDVIKLDMAFVQQPMTRDRARTAHAVAAEAERTGAMLLAEGIETREQLEMAKALGAQLGQGWLFGRPGELVPGPGSSPIAHADYIERASHDSPFEHLRGRRPGRIGTKAQLLQMSLALEDQASLQGASAVLLSTFQRAAFFTPRTLRRYTRIARTVAFVGALAQGLDSQPAPHVRGAELAPDDPVSQEWNVVVLGPHFAGAFVARDLGDDAADMTRRFEYVLTYDRDLVLSAAIRLMSRIIPSHTTLALVR